MASPEVQIQETKKDDFCFYANRSRNVPVYPYVIGVAGHRDLEVTEELKKTARVQLRSFVKKWHRACGGTAPLVILIGLSRGADQFMADLAFELRDEMNEKRRTRNSIRVVMVSAMPKDIQKSINLIEMYSKALDVTEFESMQEAECKRVDLYWDRADWHMELPLNPKIESLAKRVDDCAKSDSDEGSEVPSDVIMHTQFTEYREFLCLHSHTLLAFWDGDLRWEESVDVEDNHEIRRRKEKLAEHSCGTSSIILYKLFGDIENATSFKGGSKNLWISSNFKI